MKIIFNASVHTLDQQLPNVSALVIERGEIVTIGDDLSILANYKQRCNSDDVIDAKGRTVIPGMVDAHIHLKNYALGIAKVDCETDTLDECLVRLSERVNNAASGEWIFGHGWNQNLWPDGFGTAIDLDQIAPHNPIYLTAKSLHAAWVNTQALTAANITRNSADPQGGRIVRDRHGEPTGILLETAMQLVGEILPEPSPEDIVTAMKNVQPALWRMGLTGVHDFDRRASFVALQTLHERCELGIRVVKSIPLEDLDYALALGLRSGFGDDFLRIGSVKLFADGALGPRTAAMISPYKAEQDNRGMLLLDAEQIYEYGQKAVKNGLSLAVHAIGDLANHEVLNSFSSLRKYEAELSGQAELMSGSQARAADLVKVHRYRLRHRLEHVQLIHPNDVSRLAESDIIASMQPIHATSDMEMADQHWGERSDLAYAWGTQLAQGAVLAFGSDAPVESPNPFWGLHAAVTRQRRGDLPSNQGWRTEQCLDITDALKAYTIGAWYAGGMERNLGKLIPGYHADLVIVDTDLFTCEESRIWEIQPLGTMIDGEWVFVSDRGF